jgi:hypothetical protein
LPCAPVATFGHSTAEQSDQSLSRPIPGSDCCNYFRPPSCTVGGQDIGSCLGDLFATAVWEDADTLMPGETLNDSFDRAKRKTAPAGGPGSTVQRFGDVAGMGPLPLAHFIGETAQPVQPRWGASERVPSPGGNVMVADAPETAWPTPVGAPGVAGVAGVDGALEKLAQRIVQSGPNVNWTWPLPAFERVSLAHFSCFRRLNSELDGKCGTLLDGVYHSPPRSGISPYSLMLRACELGAEQAAMAAVARACEAPRV